MNEFDKRMADLAAERRRKFWDDVRFYAFEGLVFITTGAALVVIVATILWWPW